MRRGIIVDMDLASREMIELFLTDKIPGLWGFKFGDKILAEGVENVMHRYAKRTNIFVDLKHYDTVDRIRRIVRQYASLGEYAPKMLTISGEVYGPALEAAAEERGSIDVIMTTVLSDNSPAIYDFEYDDMRNHLNHALRVQGITCPACLLHFLDVDEFNESSIVVATGIRCGAESNNHFEPRSAQYAFARKATFAVVGREVTDASDPLPTLRRIASSV